MSIITSTHGQLVINGKAVRDRDAMLASIAPEFSPSTSYEAGEYVIHDSEIRKFKEGGHAAGAWSDSDNDPATIDDVIGDIAGAIEDKGIVVQDDAKLSDMAGYIGNIGSGGVVPAEYDELEYLEINRNTGGANFLVALNSFSNENKEFRITVEFDGTNDNIQKSILMASNNINSSSPGFMINYAARADSSKTIYSRNNSGDFYTPNYNGNLTSKVKFSIKNGTFRMFNTDGRVIDSSTNYAISNLSYVFLFTDRSNPGEYYQFWGKFYELEIDGVLKCIPVKRKLDGVIGLFDLISQVFITANYGQSNLIAGPVKI